MVFLNTDQVYTIFINYLSDNFRDLVNESNIQSLIEDDFIALLRSQPGKSPMQETCLKLAVDYGRIIL